MCLTFLLPYTLIWSCSAVFLNIMVAKTCIIVPQCLLLNWITDKKKSAAYCNQIFLDPLYYNSKQKNSVCLNHSVNVITSMLAQNDPTKRWSLYNSNKCVAKLCIISFYGSPTTSRWEPLVWEQWATYVFDDFCRSFSFWQFSTN